MNKLTRKAWLIGAVLLSLSLGTLAVDESFPGIKELMSEEEYRKAGLHHLSAGELDALDAWLLRYTAKDVDLLKRNQEVRKAERNYTVEARLADGFSGWTGKTIFKLDNGEVWQQRLNGRYSYQGPANPAVRVTRNWAGFYRLTLIEENRSVGVTRIR